jgi:hypothetical protein
MIKDLLKVSRRVRNKNPRDPHSPRKNCKCNPCKVDRRSECTDPDKCATMALAILKNLGAKSNPLVPTQQDDLSLTPRRIKKNNQAVISNGDAVTFDPTLTTKTNLADGIRIVSNETEHDGKIPTR